MGIFDFYRKKDFRFTAAVVSDVGFVRNNNEDNFVIGGEMNAQSSDSCAADISLTIGKQGCAAAVFDGMGGGEWGELASAAAARALIKAFNGHPTPMSRNEAEELVRGALTSANGEIIEIGGEGRLCGSTATVLYADKKSFKLFHLGDSRAYLLRDGQLFLLTRDQTLARMKEEMGLYDENDPRAEAEKHQLTDFLGRARAGEKVRADESEWMELHRGDCFLLCSDGLYDMCGDDLVAEILSEGEAPEVLARRLRDKALEFGGEDNVTCVVIKIS